MYDYEEKVDQLIKYLYEGTESMSGNDIKREAVLEAIGIVIHALERLKHEDQDN